MENNKFKSRLKNLRKSKKLNQEELALMVNTTISTISNYETGYRTPDIEMLINLSKALNTTTDYLVGNDNANEESITSQELKQIREELSTLISRIDSLIKEN